MILGKFSIFFTKSFQREIHSSSWWDSKENPVWFALELHLCSSEEFIQVRAQISSENPLLLSPERIGSCWCLNSEGESNHVWCWNFKEECILQFELRSRKRCKRVRDYNVSSANPISWHVYVNPRKILSWDICSKVLHVWYAHSWRGMLEFNIL